MIILLVLLVSVIGQCIRNRFYPSISQSTETHTTPVSELGPRDGGGGSGGDGK